MKPLLAMFAAVIALGVNSCGGGYGSGTSGSGNAATITNKVSSVAAGSMYTFNATTPSSNGYTSGISWSISPTSGGGTLSNAMNSGYSSSVVYTAPASAPSPNSVTITATPTDTRVTAATDTFTIGSSTTPYVAMLLGRYAIEVSGLNASGEPSSIVGSIASDGSGNITEGVLDMNQGSGLTVHSSSLTGTYTLNSNFHGSLALSAAVSAVAQPLSFAVSLASDGKTGTLTGGESVGFHMNGTLRQQDASAFSLAKISSEFAFRLESNSTERVATVGKFAILGNSNIAGLADSSKSGAGPILTSATVAGRVTASPDASGRGTVSLGMGGETSQLVYYVVSSKTLFLMESVSSSAGRTRQIGIAERQMLPFAPSTANGSSVFRAAGFEQKASAPGPVTVAGRLLIENLTHATLDWDGSVAGSALSQTGLRSELVTFDPATGRGTIGMVNGYSNNFADSVVFYLADSGKGFLLDTTSDKFNRAISGDLLPVAGSTSFDSH